MLRCNSLIQGLKGWQSGQCGSWLQERAAAAPLGRAFAASSYKFWLCTCSGELFQEECLFQPLA